MIFQFKKIKKNLGLICSYFDIWLYDNDPKQIPLMLNAKHCKITET